jgi:hypothetical protein
MKKTPGGMWGEAMEFTAGDKVCFRTKPIKDIHPNKQASYCRYLVNGKTGTVVGAHTRRPDGVPASYLVTYDGGAIAYNGRPNRQDVFPPRELELIED